MRVFLGVALALVASSISGADRDLGTFKAWRARAFDNDKARVCSIWSEPSKAVGNYTRRGLIFAFVTHRAKDKALNKVSFEMGYDFKPGARLRVKIGKQSFNLVTNRSTAWSDKREESNSLVRAMKVGQSMVVIGVSKRGTKTTDTYSLLGFTSAHRAISKACKF